MRYYKEIAINKTLDAIANDKQTILLTLATGTGKTLAFGCGVIEHTNPNEGLQSLILAPTRELAEQVKESILTFSKHKKLHITAVYGGVAINPQIMELRRANVVVATPGRLLDHLERGTISLAKVKLLVLDEADRMLDMGFINDIRKILKLLPSPRQSLMFSATFSKDIRTLAKGSMNEPVEISVTPRNTTVEAIDQWVYPVDKKSKPALLAKLIKDNHWKQVLVFSRTKHGANRLKEYLEKIIQATILSLYRFSEFKTKDLDKIKNIEEVNIIINVLTQ